MKLHRLSLVTAALLIAATVAAGAQKTPHYPIEQFTLKNGLHVIVSQDHSAPVVGLALAYNVGSRNEVKGRTGFAHLFEHMMFQGSAHVGKFEHPRLIEAAGGVMNGFTRTEDTTYIETVPSEKLPLILWLEADRMRSLAVTAENLNNQRQVVEEEKRLNYDNQPYANVQRVLLPALAFSNFANQHAAIGSMADLDAATLADVQQFFKTYYAPNNATLVLVGDVDPKVVHRLVEQYFGDIPAQPAPPKPDVAEPPQTTEKRDTVTDPLARLPAVAMAWHVPGYGSSDVYALDLLSELLFGGETSRGYQDLVKKRQLAVAINSNNMTGRGPSLFMLFAVYRPNVKPADMEAGIYEQFEALKQKPPSEEELNRVKTQMRVAVLRSATPFGGMESMLGRAILIADYAVFQHDANLVNTEMARYMAVTPEQIQEVARKYFTQENRSVMEVKPGAGAPQRGASR